MFSSMGRHDIGRIAYLITRLDSLNAGMPPFDGTDAERDSLASWIPEQFK
jgi:hypothetical protein